MRRLFLFDGLSLVSISRGLPAKVVSVSRQLSMTDHRGARFLLFAIAVASVFGMLPAVTAAQSVTITKVTGMQPGWVRVTVAYVSSVTPNSFTLTPTCGGATNPQSVVASTALIESSPPEAFLDLRANLGWLSANNLPVPCQITALQVQMFNGATLLASTNLAISFPMDLPLTYLTPQQFFYGGSSTPPPLVTSLPLQLAAGTSRYAAYPPRLIGVVSCCNYMISFVEVEELLDRGTVGLRGVSAFSFVNLWFELGGGAEIFPGWGLSLQNSSDELGITRNTTGTQESNPGVNVFPYPSNGIEPPLLAGVGNDETYPVFPSPVLPFFTDATYMQDVLDNRGVPRCPGGTCLDVVYNSTAHTLDAVNGAQLFELDPGPIGDPPGTATPTPQGPLSLQAYELETVGDLAIALVATKFKIPLPQPILRQMEAPPPSFVDLSAKNLTSSVAQGPPAVQSTIGEHISLLQLRGEGPQELALEVSQSPLQGVISTSPAASCVIVLPGGSCNSISCAVQVSSPLSQCDGFSQAGFRCPTASDPLRPENLPAAPGNSTQLSLYNTIPPYYFSRNNTQGDCATHATTQYYEALLDRYADDLAVKRVIYVDGLPVIVPSPRVALSTAAANWNFTNWAGTHAGENGAPGWSGAPNVNGAMPNFLDAYWPARDRDWGNWINSSPGNAALAQCSNFGFWYTGYCMGQGQAPPGVYWNYSSMVANFGAGNPLSDVPWSLGNTYFNVVYATFGSEWIVNSVVQISDPDAAIQGVISELQEGLPVELGFSSMSCLDPPKCDNLATIPDGNGGQYAFYGGSTPITWYIPPQLGACSASLMNAVLPLGGGHEVNIVGYSIEGTLASPDLFNSYFILENNWGKNAGYNSFFYMNFAAFKLLANQIVTYRLDMNCPSVACETHQPVSIPPAALARFELPLNPASPLARIYQGLIQDFAPYLGGQRTSSGVPTIPGFTTIPAGIFFGSAPPETPPVPKRD